MRPWLLLGVVGLDGKGQGVPESQAPAGEHQEEHQLEWAGAMAQKAGNPKKKSSNGDDEKETALVRGDPRVRWAKKQPVARWRGGRGRDAVSAPHRQPALLFEGAALPSGIFFVRLWTGCGQNLLSQGVPEAELRPGAWVPTARARSRRADPLLFQHVKRFYCREVYEQVLCEKSEALGPLIVLDDPVCWSFGTADTGTKAKDLVPAHDPSAMLSCIPSGWTDSVGKRGASSTCRDVRRMVRCKLDMTASAETPET